MDTALPTLQVMAGQFAVCKLAGPQGVDLSRPFVSLTRTDAELSLVCATDAVPPGALCVEDGWRMLRVLGPLDFALVGILARISAVLAAQGVSIFALSTYDTDYILVREADCARAVNALGAAGYGIRTQGD